MNIREIINSKIPKRPILTPKQLLDTGFFTHKNTLSSWRKENKGPKFFYLSERNPVYLREDVIDWLVEQYEISHPKASPLKDNKKNKSDYQVDKKQAKIKDKKEFKSFKELP